MPQELTEPGRDAHARAVAVPDEVADLPVMMKVEEVAAFLRVDRATVYALIHEERLPVVRLGRVFRVSRKGLEHFLSGGPSEAVLQVRSRGPVAYVLDREATPLATGRDRTTAPTRRR